MTTNNFPSNGRLQFIDNMKCIGIVLVIFGHLTIPQGLSHWIYLFHMPLFFVISGYLFSDKKLEAPLKDFAKKSALKYLVPYALFGGIQVAYFALKSAAANEPDSPAVRTMILEFLTGQYSIFWFLSSLFLAAVIFFAARRMMGLKAVFALSAILVLLLPLTFGSEWFPIPAGNAILAFFFVCAGNCIKKLGLAGFAATPARKIIIAAAALAISLLLSAYVVHGSMKEMLFIGPFYAYPVGAVVGTVFIASVSMLLRPGRIISFIGANTLVIFGIHMVLISAIKAVSLLAFKTPYPYDSPEKCVPYNIIILIIILLVSYPAKMVLSRVAPMAFK